MAEALRLLDLSLNRIYLRRQTEFKSQKIFLHNEIIFFQQLDGIEQPNSPTLPYLSQQFSSNSVVTLSKIANEGSEVITYLKSKNFKLLATIKALQEKCKVLINCINSKKQEKKSVDELINKELTDLKNNEKNYEVEVNRVKEENLKLIHAKIEKINEIENEFNARIKYEEENLQIANDQILELKDEIAKVEFETRMKQEKLGTFESFEKDLELKIKKAENDIVKKETEISLMLAKLNTVKQAVDSLNSESKALNKGQVKEFEEKIRAIYEDIHYTEEENQYLLSKLAGISQEHLEIN